MKKENQRVEKLCSFYVSDWHFATMLLPYINHQIAKQVNVITLLETDMEKNIETLVKKLNLKNRKEILEICWKNVTTKKYAEIETLLKQSKTENAQYDFKQGIHDLISGKRNDRLITKIFKTLSAMGNSEKNAIGYVLIGVADKFEDAEKISRKYNLL